MKIEKALFIKDGVERKITASEISSRKEYLEKYAGNLFCTHPGCPARLAFAETPTFTTKKIFKTSRNSAHSDDCPIRIIYDKTGKYHYSSETVNRALSDRHKRDILKKLFYRNQSIDETTSKKREYKKPNPKPTESDVIVTPKLVASIDPSATLGEKGTREPVVKKRRCTDLLPEDVGKLLALDDYASTAVIADDYIEIVLESKTTLLFYNAFRDSSSTAFSLVKSVALDLLSHKPNILICFIGVVEKNDSGYQIQIMDPSLITFNDTSIYNYNPPT